MHAYDIVALLHTGVMDMEQPAPVLSSAHVCVYRENRSVAPVSGGIICYAKRALAENIRVVKANPEHGRVWLEVKGSNEHSQKLVHCCFVYLPPPRSTYYASGQGRGVDEHWNTIHQEVALFQEQGHIVLAGDFNARCGRLNEWDLLDNFEMRGSDVVDFAQPRHSRDHVVNGTGKKLINLCQQRGLMLLNGRVLQDRGGSITYRQLGQHQPPKQSVIDYAIVSQGLLCDVRRRSVNPSTQLRVIPLQECPSRGVGGQFDHCPLHVVMKWKDLEHRHIPNNGSHRASGWAGLRWKEEYREAYCDILESDELVREHLTKVVQADTNAQESCEAFVKAIIRAAEVLHENVGGIQRGGTGRVRRNRKPWFSRESAELRRRLHEAERAVPRSHAIVQELRSMYRRQQKLDRRLFAKRRIEEMKASILTGDRRLFWRRFGKKKPVTQVHNLDAFTGHFKDLFRGGNRVWSEEELRKHCLKYPELFGEASELGKQGASTLNSNFTEGEIVRGLKALQLGKAMGADMIPAEFFRQAFHEARILGRDGRPRIIREFILKEPLCVLFNKILETKSYPEGWSTCVLTPIPKSGDPRDLNNFRGIAVGTALGKLFSQCLLGRLDTWAEDEGYRAESQFGFRNGMGTMEAVFLMRHVIEKAGSSSKPLCAAFVDFKKAYDTVDRTLLWKSLEKLGMHGPILDVLQQMYSSVHMCVKVDGKIGASFASEVGVKQGDPLSPLLFGLYIDRFVTFLRSRVPDGDVKCGRDILQAILYADDLVLLSYDPQILQQYLQVLAEFCEATGLSVNVDKSEVVVFHRRFLARGATPRWQYGGRVMKESKAFTYLGVVLDSQGWGKSAVASIKRRADKARGAFFAQRGICEGMRVHDPAILSTLFDSVIVPSACYGAEVWAPEAIGLAKENLIYQPLEELHWLFMRMTLWASKGTPHKVMMRELGRVPLIVACLERSLNFWNKIVKRGPGDLMYVAARESIGLEHTTSWSHKMSAMVERMTGVAHALWDDVYILKAVDVPGLIGQAKARMQENDQQVYDSVAREAEVGHNEGSIVHACPDSVREGFKWFKYRAWCDPQSNGDAAQPIATLPLMFLQNVSDVRVMAKFRCGMHWLATEKNRHEGGRSTRLCPCCDWRVREDEVHVFLCPLYHSSRCRYPTVFESQSFRCFRASVRRNTQDFDTSFRSFINTPVAQFQQQLAAYLSIVKQVRANHLAAERLMDDLFLGRAVSLDMFEDDV